MEHTGCIAPTKDGGACAAPVWQDGLCRFHHPDLAAERARWRAQGGAARSNPSRAKARLPKDLQDVLGVLQRALVAVEAGELEPPRAQALGSLARAIVAVSSAGDLERQIAELEARAAGRMGA